MKIAKFITSALALCLLLPVGPASAQHSLQQKWKKEIGRYRTEQQAEFADSLTSPLTPGERRVFRGLNYYKPDYRYRIKARLMLSPGDQAFEMPRSGGNTGTYRRYGTLYFLLGSDSCRLDVFQSMKLMGKPGYEDYLFLPFKDLTNGSQTYSGGRFLDLRVPNNDTVVVDFNKAYNPLCAYNHKYSCPIPPPGNHLKVFIRAGEKNYVFKSMEP